MTLRPINFLQFTASLGLSLAFVACQSVGQTDSDSEWISVGATPGAEQHYTPQGLTYVNGAVYLAESQDDLSGYVFRYEITPDGVTKSGGFELPDIGVHTSGLTWDGQFMWAVDYVSDLLYKIDLETSLSTGTAKVLDTYNSGLKGLSASTYRNVNGSDYLIISDFMNSKRTYFVEMSKLSDSKTLTDIASFSYKNKGFSQGLVAHGPYLYEASNKFLLDTIYQMDICKLFETQSLKESLVSKTKSPANMVEDLAIGQDRFWTSDESTFEIYYKDFEMDPTASTSLTCN